MRKFIYIFVLSMVFGFFGEMAQAQTRSTLDSKVMLSIYSQLFAPVSKSGTVMGQDPQMYQGQDPQMYQGQDPQMYQGQDPQMLKLKGSIYMGQDPQM